MLLNGGINMFAWSITVSFQWLKQINSKLACIFAITAQQKLIAVCVQKKRNIVDDKSQHENIHEKINDTC